MTSSRFLRQPKPDRYPWDNVVLDLWHQAMHSSLIASRQNSNYDFRARRPNQRPFQPFPRGLCWGFHSSQFCRGCNFKHFCFKCGDVHPASQCSTNVTERTVTQAMQPLACTLGATVREEHRLLSRGPKPVRPDRLAFYLKSYNNVT